MWSKCYVKAFVTMWYEMLSLIILDQMLSSGVYGIMRDEMLICGMKWYHDITWDEMLSFGMKCYHPGANVIMCNKSSLVEEDVVIWSILWCRVPKKLMLSSGVVMWCYHVGCMITPPFLLLLKTSVIQKHTSFFEQYLAGYKLTISYVLYVFYLQELIFLICVDMSGVDSLSRRRKEGATLIKAKQFPKRSLLVNFAFSWDDGHEQLISNGGRFLNRLLPKEI